ncbi:unnamed protein product [Trifolium pratense]|uniref:Uncharacterized protein n=1 Tax=Trifolium pratense TaxID=57577 RepID=A0ACB0LUD0_TRIPR|nr:unnamed protein product [Trifolium pratense]
MVVIISHAITLPTSIPSLHSNICKDLGNPRFEQRCLRHIVAYPQIILAKDNLSFCKIFAKMAIDKAIRTQNYIKEMMNKYPSSEAIKECATTNYNYVVSELKAVLIEDPEMISMDVEYAADGVGQCETALANEKLVNVSSIHKLNNNIKFLTDILTSASSHL